MPLYKRGYAPRRRVPTRRFARKALRAFGRFKSLPTKVGYGGSGRGKQFSLVRDGFLTNRMPTYNAPGFQVAMRQVARWADDAFALTANLGGLGSSELIVNLNGAFKPRYAVGGLSSEYYSQMQGLYNFYLVTHVQWMVIGYGATSPSTLLAVIATSSNNSSGLSGTTTASMRQRRGVDCAQLDTVGTGPNSRVQICNAKAGKSPWVPLWELEGISEAQYRSQIQQYGAVSGANPTSPIYLRTAIGDLAGGTPTAYVTIECVFKIEWFRRAAD